MALECNVIDNICHVIIDDELTIYTAKQLNDELQRHLPACSEIEVDLSRVAEIDSAGIQLLLMLQKETAKNNKELHLISHSEAVLEVFDLLNLAGHFSDPVVIPANWKQP